MYFAHVLSVFVCLQAVIAQNATTSLLLGLLGSGEQDILASVVAFDSTATTWFIECRNQTATSCDIPDDYTFTQGPSTLHYEISHPGEGFGVWTLTAGCGITTDHGLCSFTQVGSLSGDLSSYSSTTTMSLDSTYYSRAVLGVTITAGLAAVSSTPSATTSTATMASLSNIGTGSASITSGLPLTTGLSSTAGAPMITNGPVFFAGAAALAFVAM